MDDLALGRALRAIRVRRGWRQRDVGDIAGVSDVMVSRLERGNLDAMPLRTVRRVGRALEVRIGLVARWRGAELDRLVSAVHTSLGELVTRRLLALNWEVRPEVSFSIFGERGLIDLLAMHRATGMLLVVELKTEIVDVGEVLGTLDRKRRLAPRVAADLRWRPTGVAVALVVIDSPTNRRRAKAFTQTLKAALPIDGRRLRGWLAAPRGPVQALAFWSVRHPATTRSPFRPVRVRRRGPAEAVHAAPRGPSRTSPSDGPGQGPGS
jgi:transcriptional regulator with XRE-family HTH domain